MKCTVCGGETGSHPTLFQHPICKKCDESPEKKTKYLTELKIFHPDLYLFFAPKPLNPEKKPKGRQKNASVN
jgi:hypothetical protein